MVKRIALRMSHRLPAHVEVDDLVGAGSLGLLDAVQKFDPSKGVKIETYARHRILGAILDSLRNLDIISRHLRNKTKKIEKAHRDLVAKLGRPADDAEMAGALGLSLGDWYRAHQVLLLSGADWLRPIGSARLKQLCDPDLIAQEEESPYDRCYRREQEQILARGIDSLPERERVILSLYYRNDLTMKQIGIKLGVDESRVSQLHSAAVNRLRKKVNALLCSSRSYTPALRPENGNGLSRNYNRSQC